MNIEPHVVIIDGMNFLHRAKAGFTLGDHPVTFNAFRNLRALFEKLQPSRAIFVLEGHPKKRYAVQHDYKANRRIDVTDPTPEVLKQVENMRQFFRQKDEIVELLCSSFPISVVRHEDHECDDVIYNLIKRSSRAVPWTVVSNDSDFTQLLNEFENVSIYNPMKKEYVSKPAYDYVTWKALRGDDSDNIPGVSGVSDEYAISLCSDPDEMMRLFENKDNADQFEKNHFMIKFMDWSEEEATKLVSSDPQHDWTVVRDKFAEWKFSSLLKENTWKKFTSTFDPMWMPTAG